MNIKQITILAILCPLSMITCVWGLGGPVPDTGQIQCFDDVGNLITCPLSGNPFYGQDGNYEINVPSFTKLDAAGNGLPDSSGSWVMTLDNITGLIWARQQTRDGVEDINNPLDADNRYTWNELKTFINGVNSVRVGGYNDWRVPRVNELISIGDYGKPEPAI